MLKPPTGEPCAGEPHARFGGRGGQNPSRPLSGTEHRHSGLDPESSFMRIRYRIYETKHLVAASESDEQARARLFATLILYPWAGLRVVYS
jgi:hypothetical protein